jgi:predicted GNAT superfamily acetyltransferase
MLIRPAQPSDFTTILDINVAGQPGVYPLIQPELTHLLTASPYFWIAELDWQIVGYIIAYTAQDPCEGDEFAWFQQHVSDFLYIDQIAVAPSARRVQVGSHLYRHVEQFACARGLTHLVCEVNLDPPNPVSLNFHTKLGFVEVGVLVTQDGRTVSLRQKELNTASTIAYPVINQFREGS